MNEKTEQKSVLTRLGEQMASLFGWVKEQVQGNPLLSIPVIVLALLLIWIIWETIRLKNLGLSGKTFWDWMELLIIPIVLAIGAWWLDTSEKRVERQITKQRTDADREIAADRQGQATLEAYLDRMTDLLLEGHLRESEEEAEVRSIGRTRTLAALRGIDNSRKGQVVRFLYETGLIFKGNLIISLHDANLGGADLCGADLRGAALDVTDLSSADLSDTDLSGADLSFTDLSSADLSGATMRSTTLKVANLPNAILKRAYVTSADLNSVDLSGADLSAADLSGANLSGADLSAADLSGANLSDTDLSGADLSGADLSEAKVGPEQLDQVWSLKGAIMPNGIKHE